jgi:hypothetical protein
MATVCCSQVSDGSEGKARAVRQEGAASPSESQGTCCCFAGMSRGIRQGQSCYFSVGHASYCIREQNDSQHRTLSETHE